MPFSSALIGAAHRVEHYELAGYGTVIAFAEELGETEHVELLNQTLEEEKQTDQKLTELSGDINAQANQEEESAEAEASDKPEPGKREAAKTNRKSRSAA
jgi:ferritin-like metal-binding protein YciE